MNIKLTIKSHRQGSLECIFN